MKKAIFLVLGMTLIILAAAEAREPIEYRRTLFAPLGERTLLFEAPQGMCFLDNTKYLQSAVFNHMRDMARSEKGKSLVAIFADCYKLSSLGTGGEAELLDLGTISWMNPFIGEKSPLPRPDYLDMREVTLHDMTQDGLYDYKQARVDSQATRTDKMVAIAYEGDLEIEMKEFKTVGIHVATLIQDYPIDIAFTRTTKNPAEDRAALHTLMDTFVTQQIALNRH